MLRSWQWIVVECLPKGDFVNVSAWASIAEQISEWNGPCTQGYLSASESRVQQGLKRSSGLRWRLSGHDFYHIKFIGSDACVLLIKCITWGHWRNRIYLSQTLTTSDWCVITATSRRIGLMRGYTNYKDHGVSTKLAHNESDWPHHCILSLSLLQEFVCPSGVVYTHVTIRSAMKMVRKYLTDNFLWHTCRLTKPMIRIDKSQFVEPIASQRSAWAGE